MKKWIPLTIAALMLAVPATQTLAGQYCTSNQSCKQAVKTEVAKQTKAASSGPRWTLSKAGCDRAEREQEANTKRCRRYDQQVGGKTHEQCAKCYRQAVFDTARWEQCHNKGWAPPVAAAQYRSIAELGKSAAK